EQYVDAFKANDIDATLLPRLTDQVLKDIGVGSAGHRLRMLGAVEALKTDQLSHQTTGQAEDANKTPRVAEPERRHLTVLFCDLVGSTELAAKLDPEQLRDLMQAYQGACREVIAQYDGHVAQYLGDGLMVYFGWPRAHEDDAPRAIRAGLEITESV